MKATCLWLLLLLVAWHDAWPSQAAQPVEQSLDQALAQLNKVLSADPKNAEAYHERGCIHFKLGNFAASVRDFDKYIELKPERKAGHWQRGISCFYAGRYDEGRKQFEGYQDFDSNDVENAIWRYMCMARASSPEKARKAMLKIGPDRRVPMRQIYDMFSGKLKPADVLAAAQAAPAGAATNVKEIVSRQLFYAHLYIGIHYDLEGDRAQALGHLDKAVKDYRIAHYMWDVARVHRDLLVRAMKTKT